MKEEIIVIVDRSGSMSGIKDDMVGGLKAFVQKQKESGDAGFTLARFDNAYEVVMEGVPLSSVHLDDSVLVPRGGTALYDALGKTITAQGIRFAGMKPADRPERVVLLVITDGKENASHEWTGYNVKALIEKQQQEWKWAVTFLGCGIDAIKGGKDVGINQDFSLKSSLTRGGIINAFNSVGVMASSYRSSGVQSAYSVADRVKALDENKTEIKSFAEGTSFIKGI